VAKTAPARTRRSKTEVQQELQSVLREAAAERETADPRLEEAARARDKEVREVAAAVTVEAVVQDIAGLGLQVSKALGDLSARLVQQVGRLTTLREAASIEQRELDRLHKIDVVATSLGQILQDHAAKKQALEAEMAAARAAWETETAEREQAQREYDDGLKKQRQREAEDYEYRKALERKKAQDKYDEEQRLRDRQNREKQEALEKSWQEREAALKAREDELAQLRKEAETFPKRLAQEVDRAVAEAKRQADQQLEQRLLVVGKDAEADKRVAQLQVRTLEEAVARQAEQVAALQKQLDEAKQQVQEIAVKAIEGASGARALAHVNQIAIEQARTRPPQG
jgi:hypothetical protein